MPVLLACNPDVEWGLEGLTKSVAEWQEQYHRVLRIQVHPSAIFDKLDPANVHSNKKVMIMAIVCVKNHKNQLVYKILCSGMKFSPNVLTTAGADPIDECGQDRCSVCDSDAFRGNLTNTSTTRSFRMWLTTMVPLCKTMSYGCEDTKVA